MLASCQGALCAHHLPNGQAADHREDDSADFDYQGLQNRDDEHSTSHGWHKDHDCNNHGGHGPSQPQGQEPVTLVNL